MDPLTLSDAISSVFHHWLISSKYADSKMLVRTLHQKYFIYSLTSLSSFEQYKFFLIEKLDFLKAWFVYTKVKFRLIFIYKDE